MHIITNLAANSRESLVELEGHAGRGANIKAISRKSQARLKVFSAFRRYWADMAPLRDCRREDVTHDPRRKPMNAIVSKYSAAAVLMFALVAQASSASAQDARVDAPSAAAKRQITESCGKLPVTEVVVNALSQGTSSPGFVPVKDSGVSFEVRGNSESCVVALFSAQAIAPGIGAVINVRALLDGVASTNGEIRLAAEDGGFSSAHAYSFVFTGVKPGFHNFEMQYRSVNADDVFINDFVVDLRHR